MERWVGKVAVVTGASAGIGESITKSLVRSGMVVVGLARRKTKMMDAMKDVESQKGEFHALECDIADEQSIIEAFSWIKSHLGNVHVLVNNAGCEVPGSILETNRLQWEKIFDVNVMGVLCCSQQALRMMKEADIEGHIININSIEGHRVEQFEGLACMNVYPATKHAVTAITETLQKEVMVDEMRVRVTSISPGLVRTDLMNYGTAPLETDGVPASFERFVYLLPEDIAEAVLYVLGTPHRVQITELTIRPLGEKTI